MSDLVSAVRAALAVQHMLAGSAPVVVAVSGGPDSLALLHILHQLAPELGISLHVAHLDHQIRGAESAAESQFVAQLASFGTVSGIADLNKSMKSLTDGYSANQTMQAAGLLGRTSFNAVADGESITIGSGTPGRAMQSRARLEPQLPAQVGAAGSGPAPKR